MVGDSTIASIARLLVESRYVVVFTGAGVSTESGIPDFRGPQGLWKKIDPDVFSIGYFVSNPDEVWRLFTKLFLEIPRVEPNRAHIAIARLEEIGIVKTVITQNVDGLHQRAGSRNVIELHGDLRYAVCLNCRGKIDLEKALEELKQKGRAPRCPQCGGLLKPNVVFFGEPLPFIALERAYEEASKADLVLVVGSSLTVMPAANIPFYAKQNGAKLVIINMEPTALDYIADIVVRGRAGDILSSIVEEVEKLVRS